jgi:3-oxoacyl-[acyl-carrier-protein] synthase-3
MLGRRSAIGVAELPFDFPSSSRRSCSLRDSPGEAVVETIAPFAARFRTAGITGLGSALPPRLVSNAEIASVLGVDSEWIERRTGIRNRRHALPGERVTTLAARAGSEALFFAGLPASFVDVVLVATLSADELIPNAAPQVAHEIGATRAGAIDIGAACTGFVSALGVGASMIEAGRAEHVLVIGADVMSRLLDVTDKRTAGLFGDGAGAVVLSAGTSGRIGPVVLAADGAAAPFLHATHDEQLLRMDGHETFKLAVTALTSSTIEAVDLAGLDLEDIDLFVYHQANARILTAVGEALGLDQSRIVDAIGELGNTSAASIPLALVQASRDGLLWPGAQVLLAAVGAGFTWGATVVEWGSA